MDIDTQKQLYVNMKILSPLLSIYLPEFIDENQAGVADNVFAGTKSELVAQVHVQICDLNAGIELEKVIVRWTGNTERLAEVRESLNDTWDNLHAATKSYESEIPPSTLMFIASYTKSSPQNTFVPGVVEPALARDGSCWPGALHVVTGSVFLF